MFHWHPKPGGYLDRGDRVSSRHDFRDLAAADARVYRCAGCGGWRFEQRDDTCATCAHINPDRKAAAS